MRFSLSLSHLLDVQCFFINPFSVLDPLNCHWLQVELVLNYRILVFSLCRPCGEFWWGFKEWGKLTSWEGKTFEISGLSGDLWDFFFFFYKYIASLNLLYLFRALMWPSCVQAESVRLIVPHKFTHSFTSVCVCLWCPRSHRCLHLPCYWGSLIWSLSESTSGNKHLLLTKGLLNTFFVFLF